MHSGGAYLNFNPSATFSVEYCAILGYDGPSISAFVTSSLETPCLVSN